MLKYAFLILAHTHLEQLKILCKALDDPRFDIFIHIDKKAKVDDLNIELKFSKVYVLKEHINVHWGGLSNVKVWNYMLQSARATNHYKRYILLSGLDYPVQSNTNIYNELDNDKEYVIGRELFKREYHKVNYTYLFDYPFLNLYFKALHRIIHRQYKNYRPLVLDNGQQLKVYFAPVWAALTDNFVNYYFDYIEKHKEIIKYFKHAYAPDEMLMPTILFNSHFKSKALGVIDDPKIHYNNYSCIHYLNYEPVIEVFDEKAFDAIINSKKMFVRKVVLPKSERLIEKLNKYRLEK